MFTLGFRQEIKTSARGQEFEEQG